MAAAKSDSSRAADVVQNWMTLEFLSTWEEIYNPNFKVFESEHFKKQVGLLTFTHKDIAFEFASAISPVFKLYLIKEFQRLKERENNLQKNEQNAKRFLSKNNYLIQTDANPELARNSNVRDYATINELTVLSNLETHNAQMIREGKDKKERFEILKEIAEYQLKVLGEAESIKMIPLELQILSPFYRTAYLRKYEKEKEAIS